MPLSDIVEAIIRVSLNHEDELLEAIRKISVGKSVPDELFQLATDWGVKTRSEEIDECLYAHQSRRRKVH